jgi:DNA-binding response OmpR family regulator
VHGHILVVDDEPQLLFSVREYLGRVGYDVTAAESGPEALEAILASPPDLIISDIMMEGMDGFAFQRRVQALSGAGIPFIFLTAKGDLRDRLEGLRGGADDYIVKPFEPEELEARVAALLQRMERTREEGRRELAALRPRVLAEVAARIEAPLASLTEHLNVLLSERCGNDPEEQAHYLRRAANDANVLQGLVQNLAEVTSGVQGGAPLRREPMRVAPVVRTAAAAAARLAASCGVHLEIACGGILSATIDGKAFSRALSGLLEAAVLVSPPGGTVRISARRAREGGVEFTIRDEGRVSLAADAEEASPPETAAALDMARHVVRAHGGAFEVHQEDDHHAVVIWIPGRVAKSLGRGA